MFCRKIKLMISKYHTPFRDFLGKLRESGDSLEGGAQGYGLNSGMRVGFTILKRWLQVVIIGSQLYLNYSAKPAYHLGW